MTAFLDKRVSSTILCTEWSSTPLSKFQLEKIIKVLHILARSTWEAINQKVSQAQAFVTLLSYLIGLASSQYDRISIMTPVTKSEIISGPESFSIY